MSVMRITQQIGDELLARRERDAGFHQRRELPSATEQPVAIACVQVDGGRIRTRTPEIRSRCPRSRVEGNQGRRAVENLGADI